MSLWTGEAGASRPVKGSAERLRLDQLEEEYLDWLTADPSSGGYIPIQQPRPLRGAPITTTKAKPMSNLTFNNLREANTKRLPQFKDKHGKVCHSKPDGSDWTPAQWFQALIGEIGEFAEARLDFEYRDSSAAAYPDKAKGELADVATYLDILARRSLDKVQASAINPSDRLMAMMACVGSYANSRKKFERGDLTSSEHAVESMPHLENAMHHLQTLANLLGSGKEACTVTQAHPTGVDLGQAVVDKFNEVSMRVKAPVFLAKDGGEVVDLTPAKLPALNPFRQAPENHGIVGKAGCFGPIAEELIREAAVGRGRVGGPL